MAQVSVSDSKLGVTAAADGCTCAGWPPSPSPPPGQAVAALQRYAAVFDEDVDCAAGAAAASGSPGARLASLVPAWRPKLLICTVCKGRNVCGAPEGRRQGGRKEPQQAAAGLRWESKDQGCRSGKAWGGWDRDTLQAGCSQGNAAGLCRWRQCWASSARAARACRRRRRPIIQGGTPVIAAPEPGPAAAVAFQTCVHCNFS